MTVQIFVSYARDDNVVPLSVVRALNLQQTDSLGLVGFLHEDLESRLVGLGAPLPRMWRDTEEIDPSHQFDPRIKEAIDASALLLVVLSRNWIGRPYCKKELELFRQRFADEDELKLRERIVVVAIHDVPLDQRDPLLQGQTGHKFYREDRETRRLNPSEAAEASKRRDMAGRERLFYKPGEPVDHQYMLAAETLASDLWRKAAKLTGPTQATTSTDSDATGERKRAETASQAGPARPQRTMSGRTVFLAKPANDMRDSYIRLVKELDRRGYAVAPPYDADIPEDETAPDFVEQALGKGEIAIHLLGQKPGYLPHETVPAIVKLQLARTGTRAQADAEKVAAAGSGFRRIIWAPKNFEPEGKTIERDRDPFAVLKNFDREVATDKIVGDNFSQFVEYVGQYLDRTARPVESPTIAKDASVFVEHDTEDLDFATDFMEALSEHNVKYNWSTTEWHNAGEQREVLQKRNELLLNCDTVVLCWAKSSDHWKNSRLEELQNWRALGRDRQHIRIVVAGPPPGPYKSRTQRLQKNQYDRYVDLTDASKPVSDAIEPLVGAPDPSEK